MERGTVKKLVRANALIAEAAQTRRTGIAFLGKLKRVRRAGAV